VQVLALEQRVAQVLEPVREQLRTSQVVVVVLLLQLEV
jgi:hypothetical protein